MRARGDDDVRSSDYGHVALAVADRERIGWWPKVRIDLFNLESIEAARIWHGMPALVFDDDLGELVPNEPNGPQLLEWAAAMGRPGGDDFVETEGNVMCRVGLRAMGSMNIGDGTYTQALNFGHCRIGVGDSNTAATATDTALNAAAGSSHQQWKTADSVTLGSGANSGVTTVVATFGTGVANFTAGWKEWALDGGTADGVTVTADSPATVRGMQNHKAPLSPDPLIVKTTAVVAVFTITLTVS